MVPLRVDKIRQEEEKEMRAKLVNERKAPKPPKKYNLELWKKLRGEWRHHSTVMYNQPYGICSSEKKKRETNKAHFEFYKIVPN